MTISDQGRPASGAVASAIFGQEFASFLFVAWRRKLIVIATILLSLLITIIALNFSTYQYTAILKVTAVQKDRQLSPNLAGLASLAGVNIPGGASGGQLNQYAEMLKSRDVAATLSADQKIMTHVFAEEWHGASAQWQPVFSIKRSVTHLLRAMVGMPEQPWHPPGAAELNRYIERRVKVAEDGKSGITSIMLEDANPAFAVYFVNSLHLATDDQLRQRALVRASKNVRYLEAKLPTVINTDHRKALSEALGEQEKVLMFANDDASFAADPLGNATSSFKPTFPNPAIILPMAALLGLIVGLCIAFMLELKCRASKADHLS